MTSCVHRRSATNSSVRLHHSDGQSTHPLPQSFQPLLLGVRVDVSADDERDDVEERHPGLFRQEHLRERQRERAGDPADAHDGQEAGADGGADLMPGARAGDDGHRGEVDGVLDWGDLYILVSGEVAKSVAVVLTIRLLTRICRILARRLVRFANVRCRREMRRWPMGALTKAPYAAILMIRELK